MKFKIRRQGDDLGIFTLDELRRRREAGEFSGNEYAQGEGSTDWQPLDLILRQGYQVTPPAVPPLVSSGGPGQMVIWSVIAIGFVVFVGIIVVFARIVSHGPAASANHGINWNTNENATFASLQPVAASTQPVVWATNGLTATDVYKRGREFRVRQWLDGYEQRGQRRPECDEEAIQFLRVWIARNYGGADATNTLSLYDECDRLANDTNCTDPLILTIAGVNSLNAFDSVHRLERALAAYPGSRHRAYPQFYADVMLATQVREQPQRVEGLDGDALSRLTKCFTDGSFQPEDQQEIGEIFDGGWAYGLFQKHAQDICTIVHATGTNYQWLADVLDGEREIMAAWAARGGGYANTVSSEGWQGFSSHLAAARRDLTAAWNLEPQWPLAPERMIYVSLGDSDINEMRNWFDQTTRAQIDYNRAWTDFRWGLRPRWYGNEASLLALGRKAIDTGRYDTDVPRKYLDSVYDVESEMNLRPGQHIFGRADIWPDLQRLYGGYIAASWQPEYRNGWRTSYAIIAYFAKKYDVARTQLEALNWTLAPNLATGWGVDLSQMPAEVAARTGPLSGEISVAESSRDRGEVLAALKKYAGLENSAQADALTRQFIQLRRDELEAEQHLQNGDWVTWLPRTDHDPDWIFSFGQARPGPNDVLEVHSGPQGHMLFSRTGISQNFEVRGQFENVHSANQNFQGGLVMGLPDFNGYNWYGFRIKRHDEEGDVVSFSQSWSRRQIEKHVPLNDVTNTFDFVFQGGKITATVNGETVFSEAEPPAAIRVPGHSYYLGLGAFSDSADNVIRYRGVQVRELQ